MLNRDGVIARYIFAFCLFLLSGSEMVTGWPATFCGVGGTIELATALNRYSPLVDAANFLADKYHLRPTASKT